MNVKQKGYKMNSFNAPSLDNSNIQDISFDEISDMMLSPNTSDRVEASKQLELHNSNAKMTDSSINSQTPQVLSNDVGYINFLSNVINPNVDNQQQPPQDQQSSQPQPPPQDQQLKMDGLNYKELDSEALLDKFDNDPLALLSSVEEAAYQRAKSELESSYNQKFDELRNELNPLKNHYQQYQDKQNEEQINFFKQEVNNKFKLEGYGDLPEDISNEIVKSLSPTIQSQYDNYVKTFENGKANPQTMDYFKRANLVNEDGSAYDADRFVIQMGLMKAKDIVYRASQLTSVFSNRNNNAQRQSSNNTQRQPSNTSFNNNFVSNGTSNINDISNKSIDELRSMDLSLEQLQQLRQQQRR